LMGTPTPIFDTLRRSPDPQLSRFVDPTEDHAPPSQEYSPHLRTFPMGGTTSSLVDSQPCGTEVTTPSHASMPSPFHVTEFSTEGFSTEGFNSENGQLPNFPRMNVRVCVGVCVHMYVQ
jgi:hypothetical protein